MSKFDKIIKQCFLKKVYGETGFMDNVVLHVVMAAKYLVENAYKESVKEILQKLMNVLLTPV